MPDAFAAIDRNKTSREKREIWLAKKVGKFGASSAGVWWTPSTMREANNATVRALIARKAAELDGAKAPEVSARSLAWGNDEELPGMVEFIDKTGLQVKHYGDDQVWREWSECDQVGATSDGVLEARVDVSYLLDMYKDKDGDNLRCLTWLNGNDPVEIPIEQKNPATPAEHARLVGMIKTGADLRKAEFKYWCQVQQQVMVFNAPFGIFFTRDKRRKSESARLAWWIVPRDQQFIDQHGERLRKAVKQRDELYLAQQGRQWQDLSKVFLQ